MSKPEQRAAFEAWILDRTYKFLLDRLNDPAVYDDWVIQLAWEAWQAALDREDILGGNEEVTP